MYLKIAYLLELLTYLNYILCCRNWHLST